MPDTGKSVKVRPNAEEWRLVRILAQDLGLEVSSVLRVGIRALVSLGTSDVDRSLLKRRRPSSFEKPHNVLLNSADWKVLASLRAEPGPRAPNAAIFRIGIGALARKEQLARKAMSKERAARLVKDEPPPAKPAAPAAEAVEYVALEPKLCETCGKSFLRVVGEDDDRVCSGCEVRLAEEARAQEASLAVAKRSDRDRESEKASLTQQTLPASLVPALARKVSRGAALKHVTEVQRRRQRYAADRAQSAGAVRRNGTITSRIRRGLAVGRERPAQQLVTEPCCERSAYPQ
jgi:uncharacterized Zn finger protein (UPF0148 family)